MFSADSQLMNSIVIARIPQWISSEVTCVAALFCLRVVACVPSLLYVPINTGYVESPDPMNLLAETN